MDNNWRITLSEPDITSEEKNIVMSVLDSKWLTMGQFTDEFEKKFASMLKVKYAFAVSNCTAALHIANLALGIGQNDEVIVPALTFVATANASRYSGAKVVFADSNSQDDLTISPEDIEKKITSKTKAISIVHYAGFSCDMNKILEIAKKYKLKIIEDCAHAIFANYDHREKFLGTYGDIGCFSFFGNKNMTTGEGGMIVTDDDELAEKIRLFRSHGMTSLTYQRHKGHISGYDVVSLGYNYRIDDLRSAIGLAQLQKINSNNEIRRDLFREYVCQLQSNTNVIVPFKDRDLNFASPHIMPVIIKKSYNEIKGELKENRIQTSKHYDLIPKFSLYKDSCFESKILDIENILTLPFHPKLTVEDIKIISKIISKY